MAAATFALPATVLHVDDGDTVRVRITSLAGTPFEVMAVRIAGIDTPESRKPPGKCLAEVSAGKLAKAYAIQLTPPMTPALVTFIKHDKYGGRFIGRLTLPDGRDWGATMLRGGWAAPYSGGKKGNWCGWLKTNKYPAGAR
jgi:endonuclease YncB( thermonuclease family)